ncbi:hypothetical protein OHA72_63825 [Dactylosporangium sp. NBC_01737]|uniref:hypothetical protein n=1 Tax=Dactylosporangium sp. NBC_01737 TaxID=2975959 RepID=UPI002E137BBD|nr:hypothetical protein OHA72_63825 [Dactylosporangium sp. NBC_01737]
MKRLAVRVAVTAALALTGCLSGCSDDAPKDNGAAAAPTTEQSLLPQTGPAPTKPGASPQAGCPVDAATLEKAFVANLDVSNAVDIGKGLTDISCVETWATARTQPEANDKATVLFQYDTAKKQWFAVSGGTDGVCSGKVKVPAEIAKQLKNC